MPISLISTPFARFQIRLTLAVHPNLILEPCPMAFEAFCFGCQSFLQMDGD